MFCHFNCMFTIYRYLFINIYSWYWTCPNCTKSDTAHHRVLSNKPAKGEVDWVICSWDMQVTNRHFLFIAVLLRHIWWINCDRKTHAQEKCLCFTLWVSLDSLNEDEVAKESQILWGRKPARKEQYISKKNTDFQRDDKNPTKTLVQTGLFDSHRWTRYLCGRSHILQTLLHSRSDKIKKAGKQTVLLGFTGLAAQ